MEKQLKNNGLREYLYLSAEQGKILVEIGNAGVVGEDVSLGKDYYDRKTGELLASPRELAEANVMEISRYDCVKTDDVLSAGSFVLIEDVIYKVILTHYRYQVTDNFDIFYQIVANLSDVIGGEVPQWIQPTGAHDAYQAGAKVSYNGTVYRSTVDNNVWAPDVYGWVVDQ